MRSRAVEDCHHLIDWLVRSFDAQAAQAAEHKRGVAGDGDGCRASRALQRYALESAAGVAAANDAAALVDQQHGAARTDGTADDAGGQAGLHRAPGRALVHAEEGVAAHAEGEHAGVGGLEAEVAALVGQGQRPEAPRIAVELEHQTAFADDVDRPRTARIAVEVEQSGFSMRSNHGCHCLPPSVVCITRP